MEAVHAVVVLRAEASGDTTPEVLLRHARQHLSGYKAPKTLRVVDRLPRTGVNKFDKGALRRAYDEARATEGKASTPPRRTKIDRNIGKDAHLRIEDFLRGTSLEISVNDPANPNGAETFTLTVPPGTAPGTSFRLPREEPFQGGFVVVRVRALPGFRFKVRGSDLRCDLRIRAQRATTGGSEMIIGANGTSLRVEIPRNVGRGEVLRLAGEGLPKPRGGRGDLLVRIQYRPEVRITRTAGR